MRPQDGVVPCAGSGLFARWAGRLMFAVAEHGDRAAREDVVRVAATPGHRLRERAREAVAVWWVRDRDAYLRQAVLEVGAVAPEAPERLVTLALLGRLGTEWDRWYGCYAPSLLADDDPDVRERTAAFCQEASGEHLRELWRFAKPGTPLRSVLLANGEAPEHGVLDDLWEEWISTPSEPLGDALARWGGPASCEGLAALGVRHIPGVARRARVTDPAVEASRLLAEQLAKRREWDALWALVKDLPIGTATGLIGLFGDWAPRHDGERRLFRLMREADPAVIRADVARLREDERTAVPHAAYHFESRVNDVSFAPDGPFLAVAGGTGVVGVFDLRTARLVERYDGFRAPVGRVLHIGGGAMIAGAEEGRGRPGCRLVHCAESTTRTLHTAPGPVTSLTPSGPAGDFAAATRAGELLLGRRDGPVTVRHVGEFGLGRRQWPRGISVHRESGRLALVGRSLHVVDSVAGEDARTVWPGAQATRVVFADADTLVSAGPDGWVVRIPVPEGRHGPPPPRSAVHVPGCAGLGVLPRTGRLVVADGQGDLRFLTHTGGTASNRGLRYAREVHESPGHGRPTGLTVSPGGDFVAVGRRSGIVDVFDVRFQEILGIVGLPVADLLPRHLDLAALAAEDAAAGGVARPALELLRACLEHRFRSAVKPGEADVRLPTAGSGR